jgi:regulator of protease activity HflC (stomatin/prohibitin superfamily)
MDIASNPAASSTAKKKTTRDAWIASRAILLLLLLAIASSFFVIVNAGERGVLMRFGQVQPEILDEGIHLILPIVNTVETLSVRVQKQEISAEASSKDLQDVFTDVALNWHIVPDEVNVIFQQIGNEQAVTDRIIQPAIEEVLKAVMAEYTAEEIITERQAVKTKVDTGLTSRLLTYHIAVDDISLVHVHFSDRFREAVETKQIAEQEAKRAGFMALKAIKEAEVRVNLARGEAEAHRLLSETLTPAILQRQTIEKWNGKLPLVMDGSSSKLLDLEDLIEASLQ